VSAGVPLYDSQHAVKVKVLSAPQYFTPLWNNSVCHGVVSQVTLSA